MHRTLAADNFGSTGTVGPPDHRHDADADDHGGGRIDGEGLRTNGTTVLVGRRPRRHARHLHLHLGGADGRHLQLHGDATDAADNTSAASAPFAIIIDHTLPSVPVITTFADNSGSTLDHLTTDTTPTLTITAEAGSTVRVYQNGVLVGTATETATPGTFTFTSAALPDDTYSFTATATDAADNTSAASAPFAIIIDHTLPSVPVITTFADNSGSTLDHLTTDTTPTLTITAEAGSTVRVYQNGVLVGTATETATPGTFTLHLGGAAGQHLQLHRDGDRRGGQHQRASAPFAIIIDHTAARRRR